MKPDFRNNKDFWTGAMFIAGGAAAMIAARSYPFGTTLRMGPGYFPSLLGGILVAFGVYVMVRGLRSGEKIRGNWSLRALVILPLSMVLFGILMRYAGLIPALAALICGSAASGKEFRFGEVFLVAVALILLSVAVFIWGLGLPYPLLKGF